MAKGSTSKELAHGDVVRLKCQLGRQFCVSPPPQDQVAKDGFTWCVRISDAGAVEFNLLPTSALAPVENNQ